MNKLRYIQTMFGNQKGDFEVYWVDIEGIERGTFEGTEAQCIQYIKDHDKLCNMIMGED